MWLMVLASVICLGISIVFFTPRFRQLSFYRLLSFFFLSQCLSLVVCFVCNIIWPRNEFTMPFNYFIVIIFGGSLLVKLCKKE